MRLSVVKTDFSFFVICDVAFSMMVPYDYLMMSLPDLMMLVVVIITDFSHIWIKSCNPSTRLVCHRALIFTTYAIQIQVKHPF